MAPLVASRHVILRRLLPISTAVLALAAAASSAAAFPHVLAKGESLATVAERVYGKVELEQILVVANGLDLPGAGPVLPGMRVEIPAVSWHRASATDTWESLADRHLGDPQRGDLLARANDALSWVPPAPGRELLIPYNLRYVVKRGDSTMTIAYRFLGKRDESWVIDRYNQLSGHPVDRDDVVLVPLVDLPLTDAGREEARGGDARVTSEAEGLDHDAQERVDAELPELATEIRAGRWLDAITRGNQLLGYGDLAAPQLARLHRMLLEAYAALGASALAERSCSEWRRADPDAELDPIWLSPKLLKACADAASMGR
jgi:hypothetical protein